MISIIIIITMKYIHLGEIIAIFVLLHIGIAQSGVKWAEVPSVRCGNPSFIQDK